MQLLHNTPLLSLLLSMVLASVSNAFLLPTPSSSLSSSSSHITTTMKAEANNNNNNNGMERRTLLQNMGKTMGFSALVLGGLNVVAPTLPAQAAVGEGGLPDVTEAFQRVLKGQREWGKVGKTIADREGKLGDDEWVNTQIFLRNSYMVGEDMRRVVRDAESEKRTKGTDIAKEFQRLTLDMDKPAKSKDYKAFIEAHTKGVALIQNFFDLLTDVPDEL